MAEHRQASGYVFEKYEDATNSLRDELRNYWLNHAFILGHQWLKWDASRARLIRLPKETGRIRSVWNRMRANTRTTVAQLTQRDLAFDVLPPAADDASQRGAKIAEAVLQGVHMANDWETLRERAGHALWKGGTAVIAVEYDAENKKTVETLLTIAEIAVEAGTRDAETARYWIKNQVLPQKQVQAMFPDHFDDKLPEADGHAGTDPYQLAQLTDHHGFHDETPLTRVLTYYERPNPLCEDGRFLVEVNGIIVQEGPWPFPFKDRLNIAVMRETVLENQWAGRTVLDDVRPLQIALNATRSSHLEHVRDASAARMAVEKQNEELIRDITDVPGETVTYHPGTKPPFYLQPAQLSEWIGRSPHEIANEIDNLMGVHDVSRGLAPKNIESGLGVQILAESDATPMGRMVKEQIRAFRKVGQMVLMILAAETKGKQTAVVPGSYGPETHEWTGKDLKGQTNVIIPLEAVMPRNRAAARATADGLAQAGLIKDVAQYAKVADLPNQRELLDALGPDHAKAARENHKMAIGLVQVPIPEDNHQLHIDSHLAFIKSERFEALDEQEQEYVRTHIVAHRTLAAKEAAQGASDLALDPAMAAVPSATGGPGAGQMPGAPQIPVPAADVLPSGPEVPPPYM